LCLASSRSANLINFISAPTLVLLQALADHEQEQTEKENLQEEVNQRKEEDIIRPPHEGRLPCLVLSIMIWATSVSISASCQ
jgi:hypothetical protein